MQPSTVLLIDDDDDLRLLARVALEHDARFVVVGEGSNGLEAISMASDLKPALILLDLEMPWLEGAEAVPHLRRNDPTARIVLWTVDPYGARANDALSLGADAVLDKATVSPRRIGDELDAIVASTVAPPPEPDRRAGA